MMKGIEPGSPVLTPRGFAVVQHLHQEIAGSRTWWVQRIDGIEQSFEEKDLTLLAPVKLPPTSDDLLDKGLPCDVSIGSMTFRKGVPLRSLVNAATRWRQQAMEAMFAEKEDAIAAAKQEFQQLFGEKPDE